MLHVCALTGPAWGSPERERREVLFSDDGRKRKLEAESAQGQGKAAPDTVSGLSKQFREMTAAAVPDIDVVLSRLVASDEVAELAECDMESGQPKETYVRKVLEDIPPTINLIKKIDDRIGVATLFSEAVETRLRLEGGGELNILPETDRTLIIETLRKLRAHVTKHVPATDIALLFSGTPKAIDDLTSALPDDLRGNVREQLKNNPTDSWAIGAALRLEERIPDSAERWSIVQTLVSALNALTKKQNTGMRQRAAEHGNEEDWTAWRRDYVGELQEWSETLKGHVRRKLEKRVEIFHTAEEQRDQDFLLSQGVTEQELKEKSKGELKEMAERICLMKYGVPFSSVLEELLRRGSTVLRLHDAVTEAKPKDFTDSATALLEAIDDFGKENDRFDLRDEDGRLAELRTEQETAERWAVRVGARLARDPSAREGLKSLFQALGKDSPWSSPEDAAKVFEQYAATGVDEGKLAGLRANYPYCIDATRFSADLRATVDAELAKHDGNYLGINHGAEQMERRMADLTTQTPSPEQLFDREQDKPSLIVKETRERVGGILKEIVPLADAPVCRHLHINEYLAKRGTAIETDFLRAVGIAARILAGDEPRARLAQEMQREWTHAQVQLEQLEEAKQSILALKDIREEVPNAFPPGKNGYFGFDDGRIHIRRGLEASARERVIAHERGHGILHILRQGVLPALLLAEMEQALGKDGRVKREDMDELLARLEPHYLSDEELREELQEMANTQFPTDPALAERRLRELRREYVLEELFSHYADWKEDGAKPIVIPPEDPLREAREAERDLFAIIEGTAEGSRKVPLPSAGRVPRKGRMFVDEGTTEDGEDEEAGTDGEEDENEEGIPRAGPARAERGATETDDSTLIKNALMTIGTNLKNIDSFMDAYRDTEKPDVRQFMEAFRPKIVQFHKRVEAYEKSFKAQERLSLPDVEDLQHQTKDIIAIVQNFDREFWDIRLEKKAKEPGFWDRVRFMSLLDVAKLWKDTVEDFKTIWGRNQQRLLQDVGNVLNDALVKGGGKIPIAGSRYFAKLRGYHDRRYGGAELESVEKWKKAMEKWDTHTVLHRLSVSRNFDEIRGCIELVCDRGEMDWNDTDVWNTLEKISGYNMPKDACLRDDILRDTWLRRMISETWKDKELYYKWRSNNDSNTESQKKKYIQTVDQYSNVRNGLSGNLERQLSLYKAWGADKKEREKVGLPPAPFPDDVKPHLYEEILEYSIKNGKMSMEDKMYYIVQGVASGLLPIERLRAMAGQHGSIIQFFPYIEYFYGHNNSLPEIHKLAERLTEYKDGKPTFKPGLRTTLWLHFEVSRDEQVRARLSKGSARKAEEIDHEDIPWFVTQMDYSEMSNMATVISGQRQKVTPEGWKNAYVGFNSKMRILGNMALLEKKRKMRFTTLDAETAAKNLAAYILMDNTLTENGHMLRDVPTLSMSQFMSRTVSGMPENSTWDYRNRMTKFIQALDRAGIFDRIHWGGDPTENPRALGVRKEAMLALDSEDEKQGYQRNGKEDYEKILSKAVFPRFAEQLKEVILNNVQAFKDVLAAQEDNFLNEGGSADLKWENVKRIFEGQERMGRAT